MKKLILDILNIFALPYYWNLLEFVFKKPETSKKDI